MMYFLRTIVRGFGWKLGALAAVAVVLYLKHHA
jgi:hypothetical protein